MDILLPLQLRFQTCRKIRFGIFRCYHNLFSIFLAVPVAVSFSVAVAIATGSLTTISGISISSILTVTAGWSCTGIIFVLSFLQLEASYQVVPNYCQEESVKPAAVPQKFAVPVFL